MIVYRYGLQIGKKVTRVLAVKQSNEFGVIALVRYGNIGDEDYELVPTEVYFFLAK